MKGLSATTSRIAIALVFAILTAPAGAYASVIYDLALTATSDSDNTSLSTFDGTGTITLSSAPSATGQTNYTSAAVTFSIDGEQFAGTATGVQFLDGNFRNASFSEQIGSNPFRFDLQTSSVYAFYYDNELQEAAGTITSVPAPSATPLPGALPLFAGGLGVLGLFGWRKKRKGAAIAAA